MTYVSFLLLFCSFSPYICIICMPSCMVNKYYYIQHQGVTFKSNRSRSLKMRPIDISSSRACVTVTSYGVCFVCKQLASTSFRRQVLSTLLAQRWRGSSGSGVARGEGVGAAAPSRELRCILLLHNFTTTTVLKQRLDLFDLFAL